MTDLRAAFPLLSQALGVAESRKALRRAITETGFQRQVTDYATLRGWLWCHFRPARTERGWRTALSGTPGFPDLVLARNGVVLFVEVKTEKGKPSADQEAWLSAINGEGTGRAVVWRPSDFDAIMELLR